VSTPLQQAVKNRCSRSFGERCKFAKRIFGIEQRVFTPKADQDYFFEAELSVLDIRDVFKFSRKTSNPSQSRSILALGLISVIRIEIVGLVGAQRGRTLTAAQDAFDDLITP
jgi:hypothetical protein